MSNENTTKIESRISKIVTLGKDLVSLLRDGALFSLAVLLIAFPQQFNSILVNAGFEEGSVVGFKWKSKLVDSNEALQIAEATIVNLSAKNAELSKIAEDALKGINKPSLDKQLVKLKIESEQLNKETNQTKIIVSQTIDSNIPFVNKAKSASNPVTLNKKNNYLVGLQTLGIKNTQRESLNQKISANGYNLADLSYSYPAGERPSWFAYDSTVFYYASSSRKTAQQLAALMQELTGDKFAVQRGAGLGVDPDLKAVTLFVHYIL